MKNTGLLKQFTAKEKKIKLNIFMTNTKYKEYIYLEYVSLIFRSFSKKYVLQYYKLKIRYNIIKTIFGLNKHYQLY